MEKRSGYAAAVLALLTAFILVCGTWYLARASAPEPYQVTTVRAPAAGSGIGAEDISAGDGARSEEEPQPESLLPGEKIDINRADVYDLQRLPGIGEKRAQDIIAWREEHGPFQTVDGLDDVSGIGPGIIAGLREHVTVDQNTLSGGPAEESGPPEAAVPTETAEYEQELYYGENTGGR